MATECQNMKLAKAPLNSPTQVGNSHRMLILRIEIKNLNLKPLYQTRLLSRKKYLHMTH